MNNLNDIIAPFSRALYVMLKPVGAKCNLACKYCYYLEKEKYYNKENISSPEHTKNNLIHGMTNFMDGRLLEQFTKEYIEIQTVPQVLFTWHGGEPLLLPISYYEKALEYQRKYARGRQIDNILQTNGTLLTDEWCEFLKKNHFLVGVSIDGTEEMHDHYRLTKQGGPSWKKVMHGIELLKKHNVEWNGMAVVNAYNVKHPLEFYHFFKDIGCTYIQFAPIVERKYGENLKSLKGENEDLTGLTEESIGAQEWGDFLCAIFDEWVRNDVGKYFVEIFDSILANWVGEAPGICAFGKECANVGVVERNGDIYSCDHFVFPEYRLGNVHNDSLISMFYGNKQQDFAKWKSNRLPRQCKECSFLFACHGECPKNRFINDCYGNPGLNYLCQGYYHFYEHVAPYMEWMKEEYLAGRAPANIMKIL